MFLFNVRVYGILINERQQVLISDERTQNVSFTKFPGGGLEFGEGLIDALKREYLEECNVHIEVLKHIYTTDFFEKSSFNESQIISIYYQVKSLEPIGIEIKEKAFDFDADGIIDKIESFRFIDINALDLADLTFKTDKVAWEKFIQMSK
ncbi:NUDIX domain-containing protein [Sphingobacterium olei]|uniref:NUDIX domain-containing protein n=1 Tax=Sphingobacterium olei TaxID=2571155 RepID=A0A4V6WHX7_9SPHI|nr:NUDIX domain-containing protein [Sphingobacterium olei]TJZ62768.1 NUDIX domain-containing protein [Sphingobacterium olei]